jgi:hypothetical protein
MIVYDFWQGTKVTKNKGKDTDIIGPSSDGLCCHIFNINDIKIQIPIGRRWYLGKKQSSGEDWTGISDSRQYVEVVYILLM